MPRLEVNLDPVLRITTDAIGQPGQRVFYIQATDAQQTVTLLAEKVQIQSLAVGVEQFMAELIQKYPELTEADTDYVDDEMRIHPPVDPLFRVGEMGLGYDADRDMMVLIAREILLEEQPEDDAAIARFWCTRSQLRRMCHWGVEVASRGRPICPQCGEPMDPAGHFCPKKNGHKH